MIIITEDPDCLWAIKARNSNKWKEIKKGVFESIELEGQIDEAFNKNRAEQEQMIANEITMEAKND